MEDLRAFDDTQRRMLEDILNIGLDGAAWDQASLPVKKGGLGIRKATDLAVPAYFSSLHVSCSVANHILPGDQTLRTEVHLRESWSDLDS